MAAVDAGALAVPGLEHGQDGGVELGAGFHREVEAGFLLHDLLVGRHQFFEVGGVEVEVGVSACLSLQRGDGLFEKVAVGAHDRLGEHLDQPAVRVPGEALVAGLLGEAIDGEVVEPDVEDRVHHPGHGELGTAAHRNEQRVFGVAQFAAHGLLELDEVLADLVVEPGRELAFGKESAAGFGRDGEARGDRETQVGHLGQVASLASEQVHHVPAALCKVINVLSHRTPFVVARPWRAGGRAVTLLKRVSGLGALAA